MAVKWHRCIGKLRLSRWQRPTF